MHNERSCQKATVSEKSLFFATTRGDPKNKTVVLLKYFSSSLYYFVASCMRTPFSKFATLNIFANLMFSKGKNFYNCSVPPARKNNCKNFGKARSARLFRLKKYHHEKKIEETMWNILHQKISALDLHNYTKLKSNKHSAQNPPYAKLFLWGKMLASSMRFKPVHLTCLPEKLLLTLSGRDRSRSRTMLTSWNALT